MVQASDTKGDIAEGESVGVPYPNFSAAAQAVLLLLRERLDLRLWMVTRNAGGDQIVLEADEAPGTGYEVVPGSVLPWSGSLCAQLIDGNAPAIAPCVADVPAYANADNRRVMRIEAYIGVPLRLPDGTLFGTLCGFDPNRQPGALLDAEQFVLTEARLLATVLAFELDREQLRRRAERAEADAHRDALTDLANRRAWDEILVTEEARCRRYGHPAWVCVIDLNDLKAVNDSHGHAAGDQLLRDCAKVLTSVARESDFVARLGGDEFGVLAVETSQIDGAEGLAQRIRQALLEAGIGAAVGWGVRAALGSLEIARHDADRSMYEDKQRRNIK